MTIEPAAFQIAFYIVSPIVTFLAVLTAYFAIYRQSKPSVILHYEPSSEAGSVIDLVIANYGGGAARDIGFSAPIPLRCWGISTPENIDSSHFLNIVIPVLAPGGKLKFQAGQYGGLLSQMEQGMSITTSYWYRTPLRRKKSGEDISFLDVRYMASMHSGNSAAYDLADAMKGRNNTVFITTNRHLESISRSLSGILSVLKKNEEPDA